jgi:cellulose synthase/poly-beta-1,6-N-acetylglucosamine synthase-like glycosyltransferase
MPAASSRIFATLHFAALGGLSLYGAHRLWLLACWRRDRGAAMEPLPLLPAETIPRVTVQLPIYNERFVAGRLLDAAAQLDWPADRLEIQVLDDSTDDTREIVDERAASWSARGIRMKVLRRANRRGYKAGALAEGLTQCTGKFVAIFDADFIPSPDFLRRTIPCFSRPEIGMVQARWGFCNAGHSWLTAVQATLLGPHFAIEHQVRCRRGLFFNFNGTAGVWRSAAIESAGGWQADTVTEDLDLSYRAQLAGWRFVYLDGVVVPSELPVTMAGFRSQQQRWAKGSVQTARKILPRLLAAPLPFKVKAEACAHLLANFGWLLGAVVTLTLYPTIIYRTGIGIHQLLRLDLPLFLGSTCAILLYFAVHATTAEERPGLVRLLFLPVLTIGLAPAIALSVVSGAVSHGGTFERTPKFGIRGKERLPGFAFLYRQRAFPHLAMNLLLFCYMLLPLLFAWQRGTWYALPFFLLFPAGFLLAIYKDLGELLRSFSF